MAAFAFGNPNKVWQQVRIALSGPSGNTLTGHAAVKRQFDTLKLFLATQGGNPDLAIYPFVNTTVDDASGQVLATGAGKVLAFWGIKPATATDVFLWAIDDVDDDSTITTKGLIMLPFLESSESNLFISPKGVSFGLGLTIKAYTTPPGVTDSTDTDCPSGFLLCKAP